MWESKLLREIADGITDRELASKLYVVAVNYEDLKRENAEQAVRIQDQIDLIWELRGKLKER